MTNSEKEMRHLQIVADRIASSRIDITSDYADWINVTFACASLGESARGAYHQICSQYPGYRREECDEKFNNCMRTGKQVVSLGTLMKIACDHGIDISMPKGRPAKKDPEAEKESKMERMKAALDSYGKFRFNTWINRVERLDTTGWIPVTDRDLSTYLCRMQEEGIKTSDKLILAMLNNRDYVKDYDPFAVYLSNLKAWNPETDPDYIREFFVGHMEFDDPENIDFYAMVFKKWFVCMVMLWLGKIDENPLMPVLCGKQHIGKTYLIKRILPPELVNFIYCVNPAARVDKDFIISISEMALMFIDEFSFGNDMKSDAYKYAVTSTHSNEREAWGHFRERRKRKASLIAATNLQRFIRDPEGDRRYLGVKLAGTKDFKEYPLPYEGAYAQALYLIDNGFSPKPDKEESQMISEHNVDFLEPNDCAEAIKLYYRQPSDNFQTIAVSSGDILQDLVNRGFRGKEYNAVAIGRAMNRLGFEPHKTNHGNKYLVSRLEYKDIELQNKNDAAEIMGQEPEAEPF